MKKKMKRNVESLRALWDNIKHTDICIIRVPEREREREEPETVREKGREKRRKVDYCFREISVQSG